MAINNFEADHTNNRIPAHSECVARRSKSNNKNGLHWTDLYISPSMMGQDTAAQQTALLFLLPSSPGPCSTGTSLIYSSNTVTVGIATSFAMN
jgi:hypothetical protein